MHHSVLRHRPCGGAFTHRVLSPWQLIMAPKPPSLQPSHSFASRQQLIVAPRPPLLQPSRLFASKRLQNTRPFFRRNREHDQRLREIEESLLRLQRGVDNNGMISRGIERIVASSIAQGLCLWADSWLMPALRLVTLVQELR